MRRGSGSDRGFGPRRCVGCDNFIDGSKRGLYNRQNRTPSKKGASRISRNLSDSSYERPEGPRYFDDGDVEPVGSTVESGKSMYRAERFQGNQPLLDLSLGDPRLFGSVRQQSGESCGPAGLSTSDFARLMALAEFELVDLVEQFGVSFDEAASWHRGDSQPPPHVRLALNKIGELSPAHKQVEGSLYQGDCLKILPKLPAKSVDLVLCDLPYGTTQNRWDSVIDLSLLWKEYRRILKPTGVVVLTSQGIFTARLILSNEAWFKYKIVWEKSKPTNFLNAKRQPLRKHEDVCVFYGKPTTYNPQMRPGAAYDKGCPQKPVVRLLWRLPAGTCTE